MEVKTPNTQNPSHKFLPKIQIIIFSVSLNRFLPTKVNRRLRAITKEVQSVLGGIIEKRQKAINRGESVPQDDLLGLLMESNSRFVQENGSKNSGMSIEDVMEECKLFYLAGSETTSSLLVWTMVLLSIHPDWQTRAREEVNRVFGNSEPTFEALNNLKTVRIHLCAVHPIQQLMI